jgi:hypothetical protein
MTEEQYLSQYTEDIGMPILDSCDFCGDDVDEFVYVVDSDGIDRKMCKYCEIVTKL